VHSHFIVHLSTVYGSGQFHPAAPSQRLQDRCWRKVRCFWCSGPRRGGFNWFNDLDAILVIISAPLSPRKWTEYPHVGNRCYLTPLLGAYIADEKWGRFKTISVCLVIAFVGHIILIISSIPPVITHPKGALVALCVAIIIMGLGTGGFTSNISPLVAEQQRYMRPFISHTKSGERVVVNPTLTTSRIYMGGSNLFSCCAVSMTGCISSISTSSLTLAQWSARSQCHILRRSVFPFQVGLILLIANNVSVLWLLSRIYPSYGCLPALSHRSFLWSQEVQSLSPSGFRGCKVLQALGICRKGKMDSKPHFPL